MTYQYVPALTNLILTYELSPPYELTVCKEAFDEVVNESKDFESDDAVMWILNNIEWTLDETVPKDRILITNLTLH